MQLNKETLCHLIPHHGNMCLLDAVDFYDLETIACSTMSHCLSDNPLRDDTGLPSINGIEYGAQAIAIHAALINKNKNSTENAQSGYLVQVKDVNFKFCDLSLYSTPLKIEANQIFMADTNLIYGFKLSHEGDCVIDGRITIFMPASNGLE